MHLGRACAHTNTFAKLNFASGRAPLQRSHRPFKEGEILRINKLLGLEAGCPAVGRFQKAGEAVMEISVGARRSGVFSLPFAMGAGGIREAKQGAAVGSLWNLLWEEFGEKG